MQITSMMQSKPFSPYTIKKTNTATNAGNNPANKSADPGPRLSNSTIAFEGRFSSKKVTHVSKYRRPSKTKKIRHLKKKILIGPHAVKLDQFLNHSLSWASIVCVLTLWALYIDDLRGLYFDKSLDSTFAIINWIIFAVFLFEWLADSLVHLDYFGSLTSAMDLLAALSLVPMGEFMQDQTSVARVARTFRALRILRATRAAAMALKSEASIKRASVARKLARDIESGNDQEESQTSSKSLLEATLLERGNVKMLLGVLVLLMGMSLIDFTETDRSAESSLNMIESSLNTTNTFKSFNVNDINTISKQYKRTIEYTQENTFTYRRLIYLKVYNSIWYENNIELLNIRRKTEIHKISTLNCISYVDLKLYYDVMNINSMISTTFSIIVIMVWAMSFRKDYTSLVLKPVQRMVRVLRDLTKNPRLAIAKGKMGINDDDNDDNTRQKSEMEVIEACIGKFGLLLKVGFGEAGMNIIAKNMSGNNVFDPVIPGIKVFAIFGFCDIRNFTDCCEVLEEETMIFTNCIASVVHSRVHSSGGVVNKNIGDAFLAVWKIKKVKPHDLNSNLRRGSMFAAISSGASNNIKAENMFIDMENSKTNNGKIDLKYSKDSFNNPSRIANCIVEDHYSNNLDDNQIVKEDRYVHFLTNAYNVVDEALWSFLKIRKALTNDPRIQEVASNPKLQNKIPGYTVRMGYGLHLGWGIEGAIGSSHKVDASYLSPHVNMSARLEAASKQFNVQLLLSDAFVKQLYSSQLKADCRPLDVVTVKGSLQPLTLYTYQPDEYPREMTSKQQAMFTSNWLNAFDSYVAGDWIETRKAIAKCLIDNPNDGPCQTMLKTIKQGATPSNWKGYRALTNK